MKSMTKLAPLVDIICNDDDCVLLKVKPDCEAELLQIPGYNGNEKYLRMTKSREHRTCFFKFKNGNSFSIMQNELICDALKDKRSMLYDTIVYSFGIVMDDCVKDQYNTNYIESLDDDRRRVHTYELAGFGMSSMAFRKNGGLLGLWNYDDAMEYLEDHFNGELSGPKHTVAANGCDIYTITNVTD